MLCLLQKKLKFLFARWVAVPYAEFVATQAEVPIC